MDSIQLWLLSVIENWTSLLSADSVGRRHLAVLKITSKQATERKAESKKPFFLTHRVAPPAVDHVQVPPPAAGVQPHDTLVAVLQGRRSTVRVVPRMTSATSPLLYKVCPSKLQEGFSECASLPMPGTSQREGSGFRDAIEEFDQTPFT